MTDAIKKFEIPFGGVVANVTDEDAISAVSADSVALYMNTVDNIRQVEIKTAWDTCVRYIFEQELYKDSDEAIYVYVPVSATIATTETTTDETAIPVGSCAIGISGEFRDRDFGSEEFANFKRNFFNFGRITR